MAKETWESGTIVSGSCAHRGRVLRGEDAGWEGDGSVSLTATGYAAAVSEASSRDARHDGKRDWGATPCECATVFLSAEGGGMAWGGGGVNCEVDVVLVLQPRSARHRERLET